MNEPLYSLHCSMARRWLLDMGVQVLGNADLAVYRPTEQETALDPPPVYFDTQSAQKETLVVDAISLACLVCHTLTRLFSSCPKLKRRDLGGFSWPRSFGVLA